MSNNLNLLTELPKGFFEIKSQNIKKIFPKPSLIYLKGSKQEPLFISILLHGNEYSGLIIMQNILKKYVDNLPRPIWLMIANVNAAEKNCRYLEGQVDFNRAWPSTLMQENATTRLMQETFDIVSKDGLFAFVDIHNNTGISPHYSCITNVNKDNMYLAALFNHFAITFKWPKGVSTMAFDNICPAVILECSKPGNTVAIEHAVSLIDGLLHLDHFPKKTFSEHDLQLVETFATIKVSNGVSFDFGINENVDLYFDFNFEKLNFSEIKKGTVIAHTKVTKPLIALNQKGKDIADEVFSIKNNKVYVNKTYIISMITSEKKIIAQDCLCYLLEDYSWI